jgi:uncharacterized membrane protein
VSALELDAGLRRDVRRLVLAGGLTVLAIASLLLLKPRLYLLAEMPLMLQVHFGLILCCVMLGGALMIWRKGRMFHRVGGWIFVILIVASTIGSAIPFLTGDSPLGWAHAGILGPVLWLPLGVMFAKRHDVARHRLVMKILYFGAMLVPGAFALLPGRVLWRVFVGD